MSTLPIATADRKAMPIATGFLDYFPLAIAAVAACSLKAGEQHHPGEPLGWHKEKSTDHADCLLRHLIERGTVDTDGIAHSVKVAWRAMALLQIELEDPSGRIAFYAQEPDVQQAPAPDVEVHKLTGKPMKQHTSTFINGLRYYTV